MERGESEIGWGDKSMGVVDFESGAYYSTTTLYDSLDLEFFYMM